MVDYPYPDSGLTLMQVIVVAFVVTTFTMLFWKGIGLMLGSL
jgi:hypothetical protein